MPSRVWTTSDALAFRCPVESVGDLKPAPLIAAEVLDPAPLALPSPQELRARALRALLRLAEEGTGFAAVSAAKELLSHLPPEPQQAPQAEPWLTGTRYAPAREGLPELREPALNPPDLLNPINKYN
jgi:hypothetical protein